jgi:hypothetical protein
MSSACTSIDFLTGAQGPFGAAVLGALHEINRFSVVWTVTAEN